MSFLHIYPHIPWSINDELYDCSNRSYEEWQARGKPNLFMGIFSIFSGTFIIGFYIITLVAMTNRKFLSRSCCQLMYFTSLNDIVNLVFSNFICGYYLISGATFCTHPFMNFLYGSIGTGVWCGLSIAIIALGLDRLSEVTGYCKGMFEGKMTAFWMFLSLAYLTFIATMTRPMLFNSTTGCYYMAPFIIDDLEQELAVYKNILLPYTDLISAIVITVTYSTIVIYIIRKQNVAGGENKDTSYAKKLLLQCSTICISYAVCAMSFLFIYFFPTQTWFLPFAQLTFQFNECAPPIAIFNANIRKRVFSVLRIKTSSVGVYTPKNTTTTSTSTRAQETQAT